MKKREARRRDDPIAEYQEWAENRYNPGHWLGANIPPSVKNLWSTKDRRWLGSLYVLASAVGMWLAARKASDWESLLLAALMLLVLLIPGLIMLLSRDTRNDRHND
jgi:hypothetical protein